MAGLRGPVRSEPPPQVKGVDVEPWRRADGEVKAATEGSFVPPGVSGPLPPKDCSKGLGSRLREPPDWLVKKSGVLVPCWPGRGGGARGFVVVAFDEASVFVFVSDLTSEVPSINGSVSEGTFPIEVEGGKKGWRCGDGHVNSG